MHAAWRADLSPAPSHASLSSMKRFSVTMPRRLAGPYRGLALALGVVCLAGCAVADISTHRGLQATTAGLKGTAYVLKATGNASVTEPDFPRMAQATAFVRSQRTQLARQSAAGGGETVDALAYLLGRSDQQAFARWMQANYGPLFSDRSVAASKVVSRIDARAG